MINLRLQFKIPTFGPFNNFFLFFINHFLLQKKQTPVCLVCISPVFQNTQ